MQVKTALEFNVLDVSEQCIQITAQGDAILLFEENAAQKTVDDPDAIMPDVVEVFARAANLGMLSGKSYSPWQSKAEIMMKQVDLEQKLQTWKLKLQNLDRGALRVLLNLLSARNLDKIVVRTVEAPTASSRSFGKLQLDALQYPTYFKPVPFRLDIKIPEYSSKDRYLQIVFFREPEDQLINEVYSALETWTNLLLLGGFPDNDTPPRKAGAFPDLAYLFDATTIEQAFEIFASDEAAFHTVINYAQCLHHLGNEITEIQIR